MQRSAQVPVITTRPEIELLLCCARTHIDLETAQQIRDLLQQDIDWAYLIRIASQHRTMSLLYWNLKTTALEGVPQSIISELENLFHANAQRNWLLTNELLKLLNLFKVYNIPAIPYKGPVLIALLYGNLALRSTGDLDILVHKQDILKVKEVLMSEGYKPLLILKRGERYKPTFQITSALEAEFLDSPSQYNYKFKPSNDRIAPLEIHWTITGQGSSLKLDSEWWWDSVQSISLFDTTILSFLPEDLLLILCLNSMKDQWKYLKGVCDVAELLRVHRQMDWELVMKRAKTLEIERILFLGLLLASDLLRTELPDGVCRRIQVDPVVKLYAAKLCQQTFDETDNFSGVSENFLFRLLREPPPAKVPYKGYLIWQFFRLAMTPTEEDRMLFSLPASLEFLYYLVRPVRLIGKHRLSLLKRMKVLLGL